MKNNYSPKIHMKKEVIKNITTENGKNEFEFRFLKDEGIGLLTTRNNESYLILDSIDYWYDVIQTGYPKKKKCSCKNEWFSIQFTYLLRQGSEEIREIKIITTCTNCNKISKPISIDIDYSPTNYLIQKPITFCEQPNIKYNFNELSSYWFTHDLENFLKFISNDLKLNVYCWFWYNKTRYFEKVLFEKAMQLITANYTYLNFYFSANELDISKFINFTDNNGIYVKRDIWRKDEIILLSSPMSVRGYGVHYSIKYSNQYIDKGNIIDKSEHFEKLTNNLHSWFKENFITKRGKDCFDGLEAYEKYITKRNSKK